MNLPKAKPFILDVPIYVPGEHGEETANPPIILSANENPLGCSKKAQAAYIEASQSLHRYPDGGANQLRNALAKKYNLPKDQLICTHGSDELISMICQAYLDQDDDMIMSQYGFLMYEIAAKICGANIIKAPEIEHHAHINNLLSAVTPKTKIMFLANPNNPTGTYLPEYEVLTLRKALPQHILLVLDAAYGEYVEKQDYDSGLALAQQYDNIIVTRTFSKMHGLAGLRLGWGYAAQPIIDALQHVKSPFNVSAAAQAAGVAALIDDGFIKESQNHNAKEIKKLAESLLSFGHNLGWKIYPSVANFLMVEFPNEETAQNIQNSLKQKNIMIRPLKGYGLARAVRITIGTEYENKILLEHLSSIASQFTEEKRNGA